MTSEDEWKKYLREMVANAETVRKDWRALANELLKVFPTKADFILNAGTIGDTIVDGFREEEKRIYLMEIPRKLTNQEDEYSIVRKKKRELNRKKYHYINLLRNYMFEKVDDWELSLDELDVLFNEDEKTSVADTVNGTEVSDSTETTLVRGISNITVENDHHTKKLRSHGDGDGDGDGDAEIDADVIIDGFNIYIKCCNIYRC